MRHDPSYKQLDEKEHCVYAEIATDITTSERKDTYIVCDIQLKRNALILNKIVQQTLWITIVNK